MQKTYTFHVNGMHCASCVALTESELNEVSEVSKAKSSLATLSVEVTGEFGDKKPEHIARDLSEVLKPHGYSLSLEKQKHSAKWSDFTLALPIALGFIALFILLQKLGIVNLVTTSQVGYGTAFLIGIIASVSTCMAVIGALGAVFHLGSTGTFILSFIVAIVLLILGINLLDIFVWVKKFQPTIPSFIGKHIHGLKKVNHILTPFLIGIATFFLPCGFTQSMQIYTLTTGSFITGGLIMGVFALGTLPVLALLSFSSLGIHKKAQSGVFFKTAGLIVIFFAIVKIINALAAAGIIQPVFNF